MQAVQGAQDSDFKQKVSLGRFLFAPFRLEHRRPLLTIHQRQMQNQHAEQ